MGKKNQSRQQEMYNQVGGASSDLMREGKDYRTQAGNYYKDVAAGGPAAQRALAPQIQQTKHQYRIGREAMERNLPRGGALQGAQRESYLGESGDVGRLFTDKMDEAIGNLANLGVFGTQQGMSGGMQSGNAFGQLSQTQRSNFMNGVGGVAKMAGKLAFCSRKFKKDIMPFTHNEAALAVILETPLFTFKYKEPFADGGDRTHFGIIVEQAHPSFVIGDMMSLQDVVTFLMASVKSLHSGDLVLHRRVCELETAAKSVPLQTGV